ncbi:MAG: hypothetical protein ACTSWN_02965 [Promethearchaeota archaeon]
MYCGAINKITSLPDDYVFGGGDVEFILERVEDKKEKISVVSSKGAGGKHI